MTSKRSLNTDTTPKTKQPVSMADFLNVKGFLDLPIGFGRSVRLYGGPFAQFEKTLTRGICLAPENPMAKLADVLIPVPDFGLPKTEDLLAGLSRTLDFLIRGEPVYIGCGAGIGRTGTFMACMVKLLGASNPIGTVRANYFKHAVETREQEKFVDTIEFPFALKCKARVLLTLAAGVHTLRSTHQLPINDAPRVLTRG